ncbi:MAG: septum formation initiator family protein [Clostridia bacterium]|nr:septum formation initiator family protein [Clostridia bacterium]
MKSGFLKDRRVRVASRVLVAVLIIAFAAFIVLQLYSQRQKLAEIRAEKERLETRLEELMREQERLQSNLEYVKSMEGLLRYARENLGYIDDGETRIDVHD